MTSADNDGNRVAEAQRALDIGNLEDMTPEEEQAFWAAFEAEVMNGDDEAARKLLAAGIPIYFCEDDTPKGLVIKQYPDGRRELVAVDENGERVVRSAA